MSNSIENINFNTENIIILRCGSLYKAIIFMRGH